jgi:NADH-quinone oxidoreductase subunit I
VRADDPSLKRMTPPRLTFFEKTYLPQILGGLAVTGRHIVSAALGKNVFTVQYPEEFATDQEVQTKDKVRLRTSPHYRGVHRLNKDDQGRVKCVACMLCATACPAHCIDIVGATAPDAWPDREKYCESFVIDELRCIYCGMCEEACPVEAIELTGFYDLTGLTREQMIFDKTKLLSVFDLTKDAEPMMYTTPPEGPARSTEIVAAKSEA